ncbi:MAG: transposase [Acaryochloridaceae cyanobacterium CSU_5_19]|nr:transposase [Acaryochloridaceae cyanobacterium CSU_5_19]
MTIIPGNTDDRTPVPQLLEDIFDKVVADRGYVSQKLFETFNSQRVMKVLSLIQTRLSNSGHPQRTKSHAYF